MNPNKLITLVNKILDPIKKSIPSRDYAFLKIRMLELGGVQVSVGRSGEYYV